MSSEWKLSSTVQDGGKVEVVVPSLRSGQVVDVSVRLPEAAPTGSNGQRPVGLLRGKVRIPPAFDEPLDEFEPYT